MAVAHKLLAEVALARRNFAEAEAELRAALAQLHTHPVPIVTWKTYAALGRLCSQSGESPGAREAFAQAATIVDMIAVGTNDERLRSIFLTSKAVREVFEGASR